MQCTIIKPDYECTFATTAGCGFGDPSDTCVAVVDKCSGCDHTHDWDAATYCKTFASPADKWAFGPCNMATHVKEEAKVARKINPLKASKRGGR